jgi:GMP synthase (glutamine-hydrolysing)
MARSLPKEFLRHTANRAVMRVAILQHAASEPAGLFDEILRERAIDLEYVRLYETGEVPKIEATHLLVMGGGMSVNDELEYPFLTGEKELIRGYIRRGRPVLGICLGAQLIADSHGARVKPFIQEIGWHTITRTSEMGLVGFPRSFPAFQLHDETFEIPQGGTLLCTGESVRNQAFVLGSGVGLQFHLEATGEMIATWTRDLPRVERGLIKTDTARFLPENARLCRLLAERFFQ